MIDESAGTRIQTAVVARGAADVPATNAEFRARAASSARRAAVKRIDWVILVTVLLGSLYVLPRWADPNQNSRLDMILAVVDDGSFRIDKYVHNTVDYARMGDAYYSDKAPGAAFLGIPAYALARPLIDLALAGPLGERLTRSSAFQASLRADGSGVSDDKVRFAMLQMVVAALVAALPTALAAWLIWRLALHLTGSALASFLAAVGWAFLTPVFAYSNGVYGHQLCAFLLVAAFALLALARETPGAGRMALVGALLGYAVVTEYPALLAGGLIFLYAVWQLWKGGAPWRIGWAMLTGGLIAAGWMVYNTALFGGPLSLGYSHSELWTAQHSVGFMSLSTPTFDALWGITFSPFRGLFVLSPWLLLAAPGFVIWFRWRRWRAEWWVAVGSVAVWFVFNAASHMWWGGFAVGPRYLLPALPFLALAAAAALAAWLPQRGWRWLLALLGLWSFVATWGMTLANQAYPNDTIANPWLDYALPAWQQGYLARNLGTLAGLPGWVALLPLIVILLAGVWVAAAPLRALAHAHGGEPATIP